MKICNDLRSEYIKYLKNMRKGIQWQSCFVEGFVFPKITSGGKLKLELLASAKY